MQPLKFYEKLFCIKKERIQELINLLMKEVVERITRGEVYNEYIIESIYQIGKTEDERLFLAFFFGETRMLYIAFYTIAKETKNMVETLQRMTGQPDFEKLFRDRDFCINYFLAGKIIDDIIKKEGKNDR